MAVKDDEYILLARRGIDRELEAGYNLWGTCYENCSVCWNGLQLSEIRLNSATLLK
jgi:hypothetical protein